MKYANLDERAKERAREWWVDLERETWGSDRASDLYEDFAACMKPLGIRIKQERVTHKRRGVGAADDITWERIEWGIQWSGFWSQGDGLVIEGTWRAEDVDLDKLLDHANDPVLTAICTEMTVLKLRWPQAQGVITTVTSGPGLGYLSLDMDSGTELADGTPGWFAEHGDDQVLKALIGRACDWMYEQLRENYEHDTSDEAAAEAIEANDYDFDEEGALGLGAHA